MKTNFIIASTFGFLAVVLGAFGAHALKEKLSPESLSSFETGVRYMMYHSIVILFINSYSGFTPKTKNMISTLFIAGILFFSGSIFAISALNIPAKTIWFITPLGGLFFILGWAIMIFSFAKAKNQNN